MRTLRVSHNDKSFAQLPKSFLEGAPTFNIGTPAPTMKLLLPSAILAQILSSSTTPVAGEEKRFLLNKQRRAARARRLGEQLFSSFVPNRNPGKTALEVKPLRNNHQDFFDRVEFPHVKPSSNENNNVAEADVGLLAYQSPDPAGDVALDSKDPGTNRRLESLCDYLVYAGFDCDCSQVNELTYMGTASCLYQSGEYCYCRDMNLEKPICFSYIGKVAFEGNISEGGRYTAEEELCITIHETYLEESPAPLLCISYSYDEYGVPVEECTMMLGDSVCNLCTTSAYDYGNYTDLACFNFDCENLGSVVTGTKVGSSCPGTDEWPLVTAEVLMQNEWDNVTDMCPAEDSGPDDSAPTGDDAAPAPSGDETPGTDGAVLHASLSLSAVGGAIMLIAWLFVVGM